MLEPFSSEKGLCTVKITIPEAFLVTYSRSEIAQNFVYAMLEPFSSEKSLCTVKITITEGRTVLKRK